MAADDKSSIPSVVDGLTQVQRTVLICAFKNPYYQFVEDFCDYVSQHSAYPYEKENLETTMTGMVQNYAGSNNVNLIHPSGVGNKYMRTALSPKTRHLFRDLDEPLRKYLSEDVKSIEPPPWLMPIIPMALVNGTEGPKYDPQDIIDNIRRLLRHKELKPMIPSYKWFKGKVQKNTETSYTTFGVVEKIYDEPNSLFITQLPIGKTAEEYEDFLKAAAALPGKEAFIKEYIVHHEYDDTVTFEVVMLYPDQMKNQLKKDKEGIQKMLGLTTDLNTNNMYFLGPDGEKKKYDSPEEILQEFFDLRIQYYKERKSALLKVIEKAMEKLEHLVSFHDELAVIMDNKEDEVLYDEVKDYNYLSRIIPSLCEVAPEDEPHCALWHAKLKQFDLLSHASAKQLWLEDLSALEGQLDEPYVDEEKRSIKWIRSSDFEIDEGEPSDVEYDEEPSGSLMKKNHPGIVIGRTFYWRMFHRRMFHWNKTKKLKRETTRKRRRTT